MKTRVDSVFAWITWYPFDFFYAKVDGRLHAGIYPRCVSSKMAMTAIQIADEEALDAGEYLELNIGGDCLHVVTTRQTTAVTLARPSTGEQTCIIAEEEEGFSIKR